ncbi:MAG: hypothetical protein Q9M91_07240 [Candidatus Dojkabacteria bacterium]|nr:hypothetical protein [Candidatus Dojkabacteria bacterium]MDQ7021585.1 hypothetical protein [Candidatus Dojkabacteria bacterium]
MDIIKKSLPILSAFGFLLLILLMFLGWFNVQYTETDNEIINLWDWSDDFKSDGFRFIYLILSFIGILTSMISLILPTVQRAALLIVSVLIAISLLVLILSYGNDATNNFIISDKTTLAAVYPGAITLLIVNIVSSILGLVFRK